MDVLIALLVVVNFVLGTTLFVVKMALMDRRYAESVRKEQKYKSYFRSDRRDR